MEFQDNQNIQKSNQSSSNGNSILTNILLIALGAAIVYFLFKGSQSPQQAVQSTYQNDEQYRIIRGYDGFIEDFGVSRNAHVGNAHVGNAHVGNAYVANATSSDIGHNEARDKETIYDRRQLNRYITDIVAKNVTDIINNNVINPINPNGIYRDGTHLDNRYTGTRANDKERQRRFGFN